MAKKKVTKKVAKKKYPTFVFVGDPKGSNPKQINYGGIGFDLNGRAMEVRDPEVVAKMSANTHFKAK